MGISIYHILFTGCVWGDPRKEEPREERQAEFEEEPDVEIVMKERWDDDDNAGKNHERRKVLSILNIEMQVLRQEKTKIRGRRINEKNLDKENLKYLEEKRKKT